MNRSARSLLRVSVLASFAAAVAVAAAPTEAAPANAAPSAVAGPSTLLLYETAATGHTDMRTFPAPVAGTGGRTADLAGGAADGVLRAAPARPGMRAARARKPGTALPVLSGGGGDVPGTLLGGTGKLAPVGKLGKGLPTGKLLSAGSLGRREAARSAAPGARAAETPISLAGPGPSSGLPDLGSLLGGATRGGLPVGSVLFPPAARYAGPGPSGDLVGKAEGAVGKAGNGLARPEGGVGNVVDVLKARDGSRRTATPGPAEGPLSMPDASALGVPKVPGLPAVPGVPAAPGRG